MAFAAQLLNEVSDIQKAKQLLYKIYRLEMGWNPPPDNPSGLRTEGPPDAPVLQDDYLGAENWFGVWEGTQVLGAARFVWPVNGKLEFERYHAFPPGLRTNFKHCCEANRFVLAPEVRATQAPVALFHAMGLFLLHKSVDAIFTTVFSKEMGELCQSLGFIYSDHSPFKYHISDPTPSRLMHLDTTVPGALNRLVSSCAHTLERSRT